VTTTRRALEAAARAALAARTEAIIRRAGGVGERHAPAPDGRHLGPHVDGLRVARDPAAAGELCGILASLHRDDAGTTRVGAVVGPPRGGYELALETGRQLGVAAFAAGPGPGPAPAPGTRVLVVDAVLDGPRLRETVAWVERAGGAIAGCDVLVTTAAARPVVTSPGSRRRYEVQALWRLASGPWDPGPATCPACAAGIPLDA
jgi:orotate phosphoribosyltransferase